MDRKLKDVVCGMEVDADSCAHDYAGTLYAFCSAQCRDRFLAHPHLFIGLAGQPAPKQEGRSVLKHRCFALGRSLDDDHARELIEHIGALMGIESIEAEGRQVKVTYDLLQITAEQVEAGFETVGAKLGNGWAAALKRGFIHFAEECEVSHLEVGPRFGNHRSVGGPSCHGKG